MDIVRLGKIEPVLKDITNRLSTSAHKIKSPSVLHGKMGVAIYFLYYWRYTAEEKYYDYALELIEEIQDAVSIINIDEKLNYYTNLAAVGTGLEFILGQGFIEGDSDELLEDVDSVLGELIIDPSNKLYINLNLAVDIGRYFIRRLDIKSKNFTRARSIIDTILDLISLHMETTPLCNPKVLKFLSVLNERKDFPLTFTMIDEQLDLLASNECNWYRTNIMKWEETYIKNTTHGPLQKNIGERVLSNIHSDNKIECCGVYSGWAGQILWVVLHENFFGDHEREAIIGNAAEKILDNYKTCQYPSTPDSVFNIAHGYAGIGLTLMTLINGEKEWISLL